MDKYDPAGYESAKLHQPDVFFPFFPNWHWKKCDVFISVHINVGVTVQQLCLKNRIARNSNCNQIRGNAWNGY